MTSLDCVEKAIVLMDRYALAMRMVERYGNEHGDRDLYNRCLDQMKSLIHEVADAVRLDERVRRRHTGLPPIRAWINQPSSLQPLHYLHGTNVLAVADGPGYFKAYFLSGDTIDMRVSDLSLTLGWRRS